MTNDDFVHCLELAHRYAVAVDEKDYDLFGSCFTPDAILEVDEVLRGGRSSPEMRTLTGRQTIVDYVAELSREFLESTHAISNVRAFRSARGLESIVNCVATIKYANADGSVKVASRGVRYHGIVHEGESPAFSWRDHRRTWMTITDGHEHPPERRPGPCSP